MGKGMLPAGSICPRVRHQTFTSTHQLFSALHCQSVSMPQWQMTNLGEEGEGNQGAGRGGRESEGLVKKETDDLRDGWRDCGQYERRHKGGGRAMKERRSQENGGK